MTCFLDRIARDQPPLARVESVETKALRDAWVPPFECEYLATQLYEIGVGSLAWSS